MNQYDIAALLLNYSIACVKVKNKENLIDILNELDKRINSEELKIYN